MVFLTYFTIGAIIFISILYFDFSHEEWNRYLHASRRYNEFGLTAKQKKETRAKQMQHVRKEGFQTFLDDCVRQNSSETVEKIKIVEHVESIEFTPEERLIYRQACHDAGLADGAAYDGISLEDQAKLLKRCAWSCLNLQPICEARANPQVR